MKNKILGFALLSVLLLGAAARISNVDIASNAAIAWSKMASLTASRVACLNGSGVLSACTMPSSYLDATSSIQTQIDGKQASDGDLTALAAASGTDTIYRRSGANTWSAVTIGSGLDFTGGTLSATASGTSYSGQWTHESDCDNWARTNTAYGAPASADSACTFTENDNQNMGTVTSTLSGSDKLPGISFSNLPVSGRYEVCVYVAFSSDTGNSANWRVYDGTTQLFELQTRSNVAGPSNGRCAIWNATSGARTLSVQLRAVSGTAAQITPNTGTGFNAAAIMWTVHLVK